MRIRARVLSALLPSESENRKRGERRGEIESGEERERAVEEQGGEGGGGYEVVVVVFLRGAERYRSARCPS